MFGFLYIVFPWNVYCKCCEVDSLFLLSPVLQLKIWYKKKMFVIEITKWLCFICAVVCQILPDAFVLLIFSKYLPFQQYIHVGCYIMLLQYKVVVYLVFSTLQIRLLLLFSFLYIHFVKIIMFQYCVFPRSE